MLLPGEGGGERLRRRGLPADGPVVVPGEKVLGPVLQVVEQYRDVIIYREPPAKQLAGIIVPA